jgi:hypothetical protein
MLQVWSRESYPFTVIIPNYFLSVAASATARRPDLLYRSPACSSARVQREIRVANARTYEKPPAGRGYRR